MKRVLVMPDAAGVASVTAARLAVTLVDTLASRGRAHVVLTGGTVGIATLARLNDSGLASLVDWTSVHVWWGDERFVAAGDPDRNELQAQHALLGSIGLPEENIHRVGAAGAFSTAEDAAADYAAQIEDAGTPPWDVLMLGLGPDGHVASLFPGHSGYEASGVDAIAVHDSPKPPPTRVSLTLDAIARARQVWVIAAGAEKAAVAARCLSGDRTLPGAAVAGTESTLWTLDAAAATAI